MKQEPLDQTDRHPGGLGELISLTNRLWGVPYIVWGVVGLAVAAIWVVVWPSEQAAGASTLQFFILRWFHALVWLLLSAAAFSAAMPRGGRVAQVLGWLALATYATFMAVMLMRG